MVEADFLTQYEFDTLGLYSILGGFSFNLYDKYT